MTTTKRGVIAYWTTVSVVPLPPGWSNVYLAQNGEEIRNPCPALLVQENRANDMPVGESWQYELEDPPYIVRVVYGDTDGRTIEPAVDSVGYRYTVQEL